GDRNAYPARCLALLERGSAGGLCQSRHRDEADAGKGTGPLMRRRDFVAAGLASVVAPAWTSVASAKDGRLVVKGTLEQGSLALGYAEARAAVTVDGQKMRGSPDGVFAFGFAFDQTKPSVVAVTRSDGSVETQSFTPSVRQYEIQHVNGLPQNTVTPPPDVLARIKKEAENIYLAR